MHKQFGSTDAVAFAFFFGWGLWWLVFPRSVLALYTWFHAGRLKPAKPVVIRLSGLAWCILVTVVFFLSFAR